MSYVPPHLRGKGGSSGGPETSDSAETGFRRTNSSSSFNRSGSYQQFPSVGSRDNLADSGRGIPRSGSFARSDRTGSYGDLSRAGRSRHEPIVPVFPEWKPSERVQNLTEEQIIDIRQRLNVQVTDDPDMAPAVAPIESFKDMNLSDTIIKDIEAKKYEVPTPIQTQGVPIALSGRDILGCAETGSGKTASFSIPMIQHIIHQPSLRPGDGPIALVLAPTRELAQQIDKEVKAFSTSSQVRTCIVVGGVQMQEQKYELRNGVEIIVATPGRFNDHLQQGNTNLARVSFVVLDEADRMLDMGFEPQIRDILQQLQPKHQTLLFSATMPVEIEDLARQYLNKPVVCKIGKVSTPTANVAQHLESTSDNQKLDLLLALLQEEMAMVQRGGPPMPLTIVFVERKTRCDEVAEALSHEGVHAVALHGGLGQADREAALRDFSAGKVRVLVATDVASRGLDITGIGHVINMDLPRTFEDYVHRIGRTGRAGTKGRATSFFTDKDAFLVSQIKQALKDLEQGNAMAFATGKAARQQERQLAQKFKESMKMQNKGIVQGSAGPVKVDDKYAFMASAQPSTAGLADSAWDD